MEFTQNPGNLANICLISALKQCFFVFLPVISLKMCVFRSAEGYLRCAGTILHTKVEGSCSAEENKRSAEMFGRCVRLRVSFRLDSISIELHKEWFLSWSLKLFLF